MPAATQAPFRYPRQELARSIAGRLDGDDALSSATSLFLTAPRRTGKSTFLRHDLVPELENRNILSIYVDLWSNKAEDPGRLIADAIKKALRATDNPLTKVARRAGLAKLGIGSYASIDIDKIGAAEGTTLADALGALLDRTGKRICLIVDEAQHALTTEQGINAIFALKAARDALNMRDDAKDGPNLLLVFTGSQRDKLASLVTKKDQPFFGSQIYEFPLLDRNFTNAYTASINEKRPEPRRFNTDDVFAAFDLLGRRPEFLRDILKDISFEEDDPKKLGELVRENAASIRSRIWNEHESTFGSLTPIQQTVLGRIIEQGDAFAPFTKASLASYTEAMGGEEVTVPTVQSAIAALRDKGVVWQSARATYALEEADLADWYRDMKAEAAAEAKNSESSPKTASPEP